MLSDGQYRSTEKGYDKFFQVKILKILYSQYLNNFFIDLSIFDHFQVIKEKFEFCGLLKN